MISDDLIKESFVKGLLAKTASRIRKLQSEAVVDYDLKNTGAMLQKIQRISRVQANSTFSTLAMPYLLRTRFLDIRRAKGGRKALYPVYSKVIYPELYGYLLSRLRYGYTQSVRDNIRTNLINSFSNGNYTGRN